MKQDWRLIGFGNAIAVPPLIAAVRPNRSRVWAEPRLTVCTLVHIMQEWSSNGAAAKLLPTSRSTTSTLLTLRRYCSTTRR